MCYRLVEMVWVWRAFGTFWSGCEGEEELVGGWQGWWDLGEGVAIGSMEANLSADNSIMLL